MADQSTDAGARRPLAAVVGRHRSRRSDRRRRRRAADSRMTSDARRARLPVDKVLLAAPRGFCAGVEMAIKALAWMVRAFEPPVYCYHEIVHNQLVVDRFRGPRRGLRRRHRRGAPRAARSCCPPTARPPRWWPPPGAAGQLRRRRRVPARHQGAPRGQGPRRQGLPHRLRRPRGPRGGGRHHGGGARRHRPGRVGRRGRRPARLRPTSRWRCWPRPRCPTATGPPSPTRAAERFPDLWRPGRSDLCFATTNRQSALAEIAPRCDAVVVIGSANSSNTRALEKLAREAGLRPGATGSTAPTSCPTTCTGTVGVTAGASAPEELVEAVIARLAPAEGVEEVADHRRGRVLPAAPRAPRPAHRRSTCWPRSGWAGRCPDRPAADDRELAASDVLAMLD